MIDCSGGWMSVNKSNIIKQTLSIIIAMIFCFSLSSCSQNSSDVNSKQVAFDINRSDFDKLNLFFEDQYTSANTNELTFVINVSKETGKIEKLYSGYSQEYISVTEDIIESLSNVKQAFDYDFSIISITATGISYGGEGNEMFVYSSDGEKPKYFWSDDGNKSFGIYSLGDDWYYLFLKQR